VRGVRYPMSLQTPAGVQNTVGTFNLDVQLQADQKGTHMSRFVAWLDALDAPLDCRDADQLRLAAALDCELVLGPALWAGHVPLEVYLRGLH